MGPIRGQNWVFKWGRVESATRPLSIKFQTIRHSSREYLGYPQKENFLIK